MLLAGTDLVIIGHALGPAAIVPFAVTGKLIAVLANQPAMVMQSAQPALSEMRANAGEKHRLLSVTTALAQLMLLISGGVFLIVIATNEGFVSWWVGPSQYAGFAVTASLLVSMMLRHWNTTTIFALFAFGHERRIALTALADGVLTVALSIVLVGTLGSLGAVLASIIGVCVASLPSNLRALAASTSSSVGASVAPLMPWLVRFVCLSVATVLALHSRDLNSFARLAAVTIVVSTLYVAVMLPIARRAPLGDYVSPLLRRVRESIPEFRSHALTWYEKK